MVGTQAVLVVAIVDSDLDRHRSIDQSNDCCWNADEVGISAVGGAGKARFADVSLNLTDNPLGD